VSGDNDRDGDVPEVAFGALAEWGVRFHETLDAVAFGGCTMIGTSPNWVFLRAFAVRGEAEAICRCASDRRQLCRLYWPPNCDGAVDDARDCLEGA